MGSTSVTRLGCIFRSLRRRGGLAVGAALALALTSHCAVPKAPDPPPRVVPTPTPTPAPVRPAPPVLLPGQDFPGQKVIVIHQADLFGQLESKQGQAITIRALLMMSKTQPVVGNKGVLYCSPGGAASKGEADWVALGDVEVKQPLDPGGRIQLKMVDDEKRFVMPGKRPAPLPKNARMRLRWQW